MRIETVLIIALTQALASHAGSREYVVAADHPSASDENTGNSERPFRTISAAARIAGPGDVVNIHGGVYRESVLLTQGGEPDRPVVYQAFPGEDALVTGADVTTDWKRYVLQHIDTRRNIWIREAPVFRARLSTFAFRREQVFVDDRRLEHVPTFDALEPWTFTVNDQHVRLLICLPPDMDPADHLIEVSTRHRLWGSKEPLGYIVVRGLRFSKGANHPERTGVSLGEGHHWLLEDVEVTQMNGAGIRVDESSHCTLRRVQANDNGCTGISGGGASFLRLEDCETNGNNVKGFPMGWEAGGVKLLRLTDSLILRHRTFNNAGHGIWIDWACSRNRITQSVSVGNRAAGFNIEASRGPNWVDNCIAAFNGEGDSKRNFWGDGIYSHDCDDLRLVNNLCFGNVSCGIRVRLIGGRTNHEDGLPVSCRGNRIANNLLIGNGLSAVSMPLDGEWSGDNHSDGNVASASPTFGILEKVPEMAEIASEIARLLKGPVRLRALLGIEDWRRLSGNGALSAELDVSLLDPDRGDFRLSGSAPLPAGVPLSPLLPPDEWAPWDDADTTHSVGPFGVSVDQKENWPAVIGTAEIP